MDGVRAVLLRFAESWVLGIFGLMDRPVWMRDNQFAIIGEPISGLYWTPDHMARTRDGKLVLDVAAAENAEKLAALRQFISALPVVEVEG